MSIVLAEVSIDLITPEMFLFETVTSTDVLSAAPWPFLTVRTLYCAMPESVMLLFEEFLMLSTVFGSSSSR